MWTGRRGKLHIWSEVVYIVAFYSIYSLIRNTQGSGRDAHGQAFTNAERVIRWEKSLHLFHEEPWQARFLGMDWLMKLLNTWYGTAHFFVTIVALVWAFKRMPARYRSVRNALGFATATALIGFAFFPLTPPRLLPSSYNFVDTLKVYGGPWSFDSGAVAKMSNQYAAMPSLHFGWSSWVVYALWPWARTGAQRLAKTVLLLLYPLSTLFTIVVTGNHYILDAAGGFAVFAAGIVLGRLLDRAAVVDRVRLRDRIDAMDRTERG